MVIALGKNSGWITWADSIWLQQNIESDPQILVDGLLRRVYTDVDNKFPYPRDKAQACLIIAKQNSNSLTKDPVDLRRFEDLMSTSPDDFASVFSKFRLWEKGYTNADVEAAQEEIESDRETFLNVIDQRISVTQLHIQHTSGAKRRIQVDRLNDLLEELRKLRRSVEALLANKNLGAVIKVRHLVDSRRLGTLGANEDYLNVYWRLQYLDPLRINFPLRHLGFLPAADFDRILDSWRQGATRDELMEIMVTATNGLITETTLLEQYAPIERVSRQSRVDLLREIHAAWNTNCFLSACLVALTQTEGLLWDFAEFLNGRNFRIFRRRESGEVHYYSWDDKKAGYDRPANSRHGFVYVRARRKTARELLHKSRLRSILYTELYFYLIDEFYDDRNSLAHGDFKQRDLKADATAAILSLFSVMMEIQRYLEEQKIIPTRWAKIQEEVTASEENTSVATVSK